MKTEDLSIKGLYRVLEKSTESVNKITIRVEIVPEHPVFSGHFPGNPVLPGMATVEILRELITLHLDSEARLIKAPVIKFLNFVNPVENNIIDFGIELSNTDQGSFLCSSLIHFEKTVFCSFKGEFRV
ncbi:MAG: hypothetical protein JXR66_10175 [Bacteroidales bacterium]|nr:hypothetical protein [Bacteroidales bacterium]